MVRWAAYERAEGPLLLQERIDYAAARIAFSIVRALGAKDAEPEHFLPPYLKP